MRKELIVLGVIVVAVIVTAMIGSSYYQRSLQNQPKPSPAVNQRLVRPDSATLGAPDAKVTIVEFLDPECETCRAFSPVVKGLVKGNEGRVRLVVRYMPFHGNSRLAATYTEAAAEQGKFWEMLEILFERQPEWGDRHGQPSAAPHEPPNAAFERYAREIGLDLDKVRTAVALDKYAAKIDRDMKDGESLGVTRTPSFFVNGRPLMRFSEQDLRALVESELK